MNYINNFYDLLVVNINRESNSLKLSYILQFGYKPNKA